MVILVRQLVIAIELDKKMATTNLLKPSLVVKILHVFACASSFGGAIWLTVTGFHAGSFQSLLYFATALGVILVVTLAGKRGFELCSVKLTDQGIEQLCLFSGKQIIQKKKLLWTEITNVAAKPGAFLLIGQAYNVEVETMVFSNAKAVIEFVRTRCSM